MGKFGGISDRGSNFVNLRDHMNFRTANRSRWPIGNAPTSKPLVLLLQGPVGPFFDILAKALVTGGYDTLKVNFNGGDWLFSHGKGALNFCGTTDAWADWLKAFIKRDAPLVIVLFGDCRPYHRMAIDVAGQLGVPVLCFEEGYARPHFISCEWGGNNARSPLRTDTSVTADSDMPLEPVELMRGNLFRSMAMEGIAYYVVKALGAPFFFGNEHHRDRAIVSEVILWARNFYRKLRYYPRNNNLTVDLIENQEGRYFVVALQVHDDQQLLSHGRGWTMERLITETIRSFARCANPAHQLVFKIHPMDRGHKSYRPFVKQLAMLSKCEERVQVLDDGSIGLLIRHSLGLVTVNSTSGLLALNHGKPLLALGDTFYGAEGLATLPKNDALSATAIDDFWQSPIAPQKERVQQFVRHMYRQSLVNGSFYLRPYIEGTAERVVQRIRQQFPAAEAARTVVFPHADNSILLEQPDFGSRSGL
ncbi:capsular biosynthesis protein [Rhizobium sp. RCC_161_2]|uniref:capsular polysaccharide export protein, LipB/KpsS family n=1 Tax=Rhizobium sp. RCC_161_2 TaxID=3239219 RepID=UPI003524D270